MQSITIKVNRRTVQITGLFLLGIFLSAAVYYLRMIFHPVLIALILAYILNPLVNLLERHRIPRTVTIFGMYILITSAVLIFLILVPLISSEVDTLYQKMFRGDEETPPYTHIIIEKLKIGIQKWNARYPHQKIELGMIPKEPFTQGVVKFSGNTLETAVKTVFSIFAILSYLILLPLYTFFLLRSLNNIWATIESYLPASRKERILEVLGQMHRAVAAFFRGKLIICLIKGLITWGCLELIGVKFALIFAGIQTVASIIPFLVLLIGMFPNLLFVLLDIGMSWPYLLGVVAIYLAIEGLESFFLTPWIMGKETGMHPLTVILALLIGARLWGLLGLLIAIPLASSLKILGHEVVLPHLNEVMRASPAPEPVPEKPPEPAG